MNIVNVGYDSTNYYLIGPDSSRLLIDVDWPDTFPKLANMLKRKQVAFNDIKYLLATHYHPDHAGMAQELKDRSIPLVVIDIQLAAIRPMGRYMKPRQHYREIGLDDNVLLAAGETREFLSRMGIAGEIIITPGHSDDSVTLILDEGQAFTGDLPTLMLATEDAQALVAQSWDKIRGYGVKTIYPAHGPVRKLVE